MQPMPRPTALRPLADCPPASRPCPFGPRRGIMVDVGRHWLRWNAARRCWQPVDINSDPAFRACAVSFRSRLTQALRALWDRCRTRLSRHRASGTS